MRSSDPNLYIVPDGYIELRRAQEETVKKLFRAKYVAPLTRPSINTELIKGKRRRRWDAVSKLLLRDFVSGKLPTFLLKDGEAQPIDCSHWREWEPSWRPFVRDTLGIPGAPVYLLRHNDWQRWVAAWPWVNKKADIVLKSDAINPVSRKPRRRGRPKGTGRYTDDARLVAQAEDLLKRGKANSKLNAAVQVAGDPNAVTYQATVERVRKKIKGSRAGQ